tara:strand:- start:994 stop:1236 length:243 start_codon:yes stop_codon:yes gene_type:complete
MNVPYDFRYHAEIMYETLDGFNFCNANGDTIEELLWDIDERFDYYQYRFPKIAVVLEYPNTKKLDITKKIIKKYYSRGSK